MEKHPKVEVAFAPTKSFVKHWPQEVSTQKKKFERPSWAQPEEENMGKEDEKKGSSCSAPDTKCPMSAREIALVSFFAGVLIGTALWWIADR